MQKQSRLRPWMVGAFAILAIAGIAGGAGVLTRSAGVRFVVNSTPPIAGTATNPVLWADNGTIPNGRFGDGTNANYVAACVPTSGGDYCSWNGSNWARTAAPAGSTTLATAYTNGAGASDETLLYTAARGPLILKDNATPIGTLFSVQTSGAAVLWALNATTMTYPVNAVFTPTAQSATNTTSTQINTNVPDGASSVALDVNNTTSLVSTTSDLLRLRNNGTIDYEFTSGTTHARLWGLNGNAGNGSFIQLDGSGVTVGYSSDNISLGIDSAVLGFNFHVTSDLAYLDGTSFRPAVDLTGLPNGDSTHRWPASWSKQYIGVSNTVANSATPAINCTNGETLQVGAIAQNVTGATMTSGTGPGQLCTVVFLKDGTANTYTIAWSGTNVRSAGATMAAGASSLTTYIFRWDDRLATPAWVQDAPSVNVN